MISGRGGRLGSVIQGKKNRIPAKKRSAFHVQDVRDAGIIGGGIHNPMKVNLKCTGAAPTSEAPGIDPLELTSGPMGSF